MGYFRLSSLLVLSASILLASCTDSETLAPPDAVLESSTAIQGEVDIRNQGINLNDTHFSARVRTRTVVDAGQPDQREMAALSSLVIDEYDEDRHIEAGYSAYGDLLFDMYWEDPSLSPHIGSIRTAGNTMTMYDRAGGVLLTDGFDGFMAGVGLPGGSMLDAYIDDGGSSGGGGGCDPADPMCPGDVEPTSVTGVETTVTDDGEWREVRITTTASTAVPQTAGEGSWFESVRRYRAIPRVRGGGRMDTTLWRLEEISHTRRLGTNGGGTTVRSHTTIDYQSWYRNLARDAARKRRARSSERVAGQPGGARGEVDGASGASAGETAVLSSMGSDCHGGSSPRDTMRIPSGTSIIYQHGICSDASTWDGMRPSIASTHVIGRERAFSVDDIERLGNQASELEQEIVASGGLSSIVVGHSQGGLIARKLGQRRSDLVQGVITIGSPHEGAIIAIEGPQWVADKLNMLVNNNLCYSGSMCGLINGMAVGAATGALTYGLAGTLVPVITDVRPGSAFLGTLNGTYEPFRRASIQVAPRNRWVLSRILGDMGSDREKLLTGQRPNGVEWVEATENLYRAGWFLQGLAMFLWYHAPGYGGGVHCGYSGYETNWAPCYDPYYSNYWYQTSYWSNVAHFIFQVGDGVTSSLDWVDREWDYITTRRADYTDGFIQYSSQIYPEYVPGAHPPVHYPIPGGDSHTGETASPDVLRRLRQALSDQGVITR